MANSQPTCVRVDDATRIHLSALLTEEQHSVESVAVAVEMLTNAGYLPKELYGIAQHIVDAQADLANRIDLFFEEKKGARHAA